MPILSLSLANTTPAALPGTSLVSRYQGLAQTSALTSEHLFNKRHEHTDRQPATLTVFCTLVSFPPSPAVPVLPLLSFHLAEVVTFYEDLSCFPVVNHQGKQRHAQTANLAATGQKHQAEVAGKGKKCFYKSLVYLSVQKKAPSESTYITFFVLLYFFFHLILT